ncbi:MAG: class I SAM-dependent methyltransferase [Lachnospiraceae bacterium]|nr:class I SAM-dependent methyltransferase [Lachnospiraceae bacterium]
MKPYSSFSRIYDLCMDNVPYDEWAERITELLSRNGVPDGGIVAELGCGTGNISRRLRDAGYDVIGIDASEEMLMVAQDKEYERLADWYDTLGENDPDSDPECESPDGRITYLCQDIRSFELYGTTAAIVSVCDTLNYLLTKDDLRKTFSLVNNYLDREGVFCFDMKTRSYYEKVLGNRVRVEDYEDATLIWDNAYDAKSGRNEYRLTMFLKDESELYTRQDELHVQMAYDLDEIRELLAEGGMTFVAAYDAYTERPATEASERIVIIAKEGFQEQKYYG